jgi:hypothetical protein
MAQNQTQPIRPQQPEQQNRLMLAGIALLGIASIAALAVLGGQSSFEPTQPPNAAGSHTAMAQSSGPKVSVVRVDAGGNAVIAGTAAPGAKVTIKSGDAAIGTVDADLNGAFTFVTGKPLPPGNQTITVSSQILDGPERIAARGVAVDVPAAPSEGALAVLSGKSLVPSRLLGGAGPSPAKPNPHPLAMGSVDYAGSGSATITGTAPPGSEVELFMGRTRLGQAVTGADGRWDLHTNALPQQPGRFHLRAMGAHGGGNAAAR